MTQQDDVSPQLKWARLRFSIVGELLAAPPDHGQLQARLRALAERTWRNPITGEATRFGMSTIERWFYLARDAPDPIEILRRNVRRDAGKQHLDAELVSALERQFRHHPTWTYKLHADNIDALVEEHPEWGKAPSYTTIRRAMKSRGWLPRRGKGVRKVEAQWEQREVRGYEASHVHALWHLDFHVARRKLLDARGNYFTPALFAVIDDRSRLICHLQWYRIEDTECLVHGLTQAFLRRGLPRAIMTDRGGAQLAAETTQGLADLGVIHKTTLPESPHQNAKQERFWGTLEGRLMKMLEHVELDLQLLNRATLAWVEHDYHHEKHDELDATPLEVVLAEPAVSRKAPELDAMRRAFTHRCTRIQRRGDGTISLDGVRFEMPARLRHVRKVHVRYQRWDLTRAWVTDPATDVDLARIKPLDKRGNASGRRREIDVPDDESAETEPQSSEMPPLMRKILRDFAATGLPTPYIPHHSDDGRDGDEDHDD